MIKYEKPMVIEKGYGEGVYTESGYFVEDDSTVSVLWDNHNSGSHSDLRIKLNTGRKFGEHIVVTVSFVGNGEIVSVGGYSGGFTSVSVNGNSITFVREGHYNANENFDFGFDNVIFSELKAGTEGDGQHSGSYYPGNGNGYIGDAVLSGDFVVVNKELS